VVKIEWHLGHPGHVWQGVADGRGVAEVVGYGHVVGSDDRVKSRYWVAWVGRERLPQEYPTDDEAKAAVEVTLSLS
jgi:hypothetical protein